MLQGGCAASLVLRGTCATAELIYCRRRTERRNSRSAHTCTHDTTKLLIGEYSLLFCPLWIRLGASQEALPFRCTRASGEGLTLAKHAVAIPANPIVHSVA